MWTDIVPEQEGYYWVYVKKTASSQAQTYVSRCVKNDQGVYVRYVVNLGPIDADFILSCDFVKWMKIENPPIP